MWRLMMKMDLHDATERILGASGTHVFEGSCLWMACTLFFLVLVHFSCVRARYGWTKKVQLAVCCMAGIHGTTATLLSAREIYYAWPISMDMINTNNQERTVFLSTGYFVFDLLHLILMQPHELTFILHHLVVAVYMISSVVLGRGLISSLVMMCIGEVTNMFLNVWLIAKDTRKEYEGARLFFDRFSPYFTVIYVFFRSILGPPITFWVIRGLIGSSELPPLLKYGWSILIALGTLGSQMWSLKLVKNTLKKRKSQKKMA